MSRSSSLGLVSMVVILAIGAWIALAIESIETCPSCPSGPCPCSIDYRIGPRLLVVVVTLLVAGGAWDATRHRRRADTG